MKNGYFFYENFILKKFVNRKYDLVKRRNFIYLNEDNEIFLLLYIFFIVIFLICRYVLGFYFGYIDMFEYYIIYSVCLLFNNLFVYVLRV